MTNKKGHPLFLLILLFIIACKQDNLQPGPSGGSSATVSTFVGSTSGYLDGQGVSSKFAHPHGIAVDRNGNLYVADNGNQRIRKISGANVSTLAGAGTVGNLDGTGTSALFNYPEGVATDVSGNIYVADEENNSIRKITPAGIVTTLAGGGQGYADGQGVAAQFSFPKSVAVDASGNVYVADTENYRIRKITPGGLVSTLAGGTEGYLDGTGTNAKFRYPTGIAIDASANLFVTDAYVIRKISPTGVVTTLAGGSTGYADGQGTEARFTDLYGICVDGNDIIYVTDSGNQRIRKITQTGSVTTIAGGIQGYADGQGSDAQFNSPKGIIVSGGILYVADENNNRIRKIIP